MRLATLATCALNQWAMDFEGNTNRIIASIREAKARGASYRIGPELEITGYGCEDHFLEHDTCQHAYATLSIPLTESRHPCPPCHVASVIDLPSSAEPWECLAAALQPASSVTSGCQRSTAAWECLAAIIASGATAGILCDIGLPVEHRGVRYNCRAFVHSRRILLLRPKMDLANDGNYRETRWFATWKRLGVVESVRLPAVVTAACEGQREVPIGDGVLDLLDSTLASETCEELFTPLAPHIQAALAGAEVVGNGSGSHHELRKLGTRVGLVQSATSKAGGVYLYANQKGCDGGRLYYDGCAMVVVNGQVVAQGSQFSLADVEVVTATVDLDQVASYRGAISSMREQASASAPAPSASFPTLPSSASASPGIVRIPSDISICHPASASLTLATSHPIQIRYHCPEEEIALGPACWLWDYLRRSGASGFLLPLSGGADSSSVAAIVGCMCQLVVKAIAEGDEQVQQDAERITGLQLAAGAAAEEQKRQAARLADRILNTIYMGTENSWMEAHQQRTWHCRTSKRACACCSPAFLSSHPVPSHLALASSATNHPSHQLDGGTSAENLALQNIQARLRMVLAFLFAQLLPWVRGHGRGGGGGGEQAGEKGKEEGRKEGTADGQQRGGEGGGRGGGEEKVPVGGVLERSKGRGGGSEQRGGGGGFLLVLGSANVDEALRGYLTKVCIKGEHGVSQASTAGAYRDINQPLVLASANVDEALRGYLPKVCFQREHGGITVVAVRVRQSEHCWFQREHGGIKFFYLKTNIHPFLPSLPVAHSPRCSLSPLLTLPVAHSSRCSLSSPHANINPIGDISKTDHRRFFGGSPPWLRLNTPTLPSPSFPPHFLLPFSPYDCSSADINPIGGISKTDLRRFLRWAAVHLGFASLADVEAAPPTAELEPIRADYVQVDEVDMGMTYEELSLYGRLRKVLRCGPVAMFQHLCHEWRQRLTVAEVAGKVKAFFRFYSINRHKMTTLTPSYHAENYSPEDNRFDLRQFLYNVAWPWQFKQIDQLVAEHEAAAGAGAATLSSEGSNAAGAAM
ncbi:unnamed protein product [Closterium sp. NIES-65]|nr:unnamed protein product [Closterium sp. NIES-65]